MTKFGDLIKDMTINELFRSFTDANFQYNRFIKTNCYDSESLQKFDTLFESIRIQVIQMDLSESISEELQSIGRIDIAFTPEISLIRKIFGFITFGISKKIYIKKQIKHYFLSSIHARHIMIHTIQIHLSQE